MICDKFWIICSFGLNVCDGFTCYRKAQKIQKEFIPQLHSVWHWTIYLFAFYTVVAAQKVNIFFYGGLLRLSHSENALWNLKNKQFWIMANSLTGVLDNNAKKLLSLQSWLPSKKQSMETHSLSNTFEQNKFLSLSSSHLASVVIHMGTFCILISLLSLFLSLVLCLCLPSHLPLFF